MSKILYALIGLGFATGTYLVGPGALDKYARRPAPQPPPTDAAPPADRPPPTDEARPADPPPPAAWVQIDIVNSADIPVCLLVDPQFHTLAVFTYRRDQTPVLGPGDLQRFGLPPGPYQVLVDGCPRGDVVMLSPDRPFRLEFGAGPPGQPAVAMLIAGDSLMFQTVLRPEPPPTIVYACPLHPQVRFLTPCACPVCQVQLVVIRPVVVYTCPLHTHVHVEAGGTCPECSTGLVVQMQFHFESERAGVDVNLDPLGPEGGTRVDVQGRVEHKHKHEAPPEEQPQAPPKAKPEEQPKEQPKAKPEEPPKEQPKAEPEKPKEPPKAKPEEKPKEPPKEKKPKQPKKHPHGHEEEEPKGAR